MMVFGIANSAIERKVEIFPPLKEANSIPRIFWVAVFLLFLVVHSPWERVSPLLENVPALKFNLSDPSNSQTLHVKMNYFVPAKTIVFLTGFLILLIPVVSETKRFCAETSINWTRNFLYSIIIFAILRLMLFSDGLQGNGWDYGQYTFSPFLASGTHYKRLLMPFIASECGFSGEAFYYAFSFLSTLLLIFLTTLWFEVQASSIPFLPLVSLSTCSFIAFQFHFPGYVEQLGFIWILLSLILNDSSRVRLSLFVFSLLSHEALVATLIPISYFIFPKKDFVRSLKILGIYGILWCCSFQFNFAEAFSGYEIYEAPTYQMAIGQYIDVLFGIFISYKLIWLPIISAVILLLRERKTREAYFIVLNLGASIGLVFLGIDISRLVGFSFVSALYSVSYLLKSDWGNSKILNLIFFLNLFVPPFYHGLDTLYFMRRGSLYSDYLLFLVSIKFR